ncbi:MAG: hypothetical protein J6Y61_03325 [Bacteroidales bacterium]|nr:hypothetical protein [Bacteroidales bacterium]
MNKVLKSLLTWLVLPAVIALLVYVIVNSIMQPVRFNKEKDFRQSVAVQQMKDIRTLQVAYKGETGKFAPTIDSLKQFYNTGDMSVIMQIGSADDSVAVAHTDVVKKSPAFKNLKGNDLNQALYQAYLAGDNNLVFTVANKIPVRDTLFNDRTDFNVSTLDEIPFSNGDKVIMEEIVKTVSGVPVPLFEAKMPYKSLLKGLDNQLRINLDAEQRDMNRYEGLQVGSITAPNNNAGNWE